MSTADRHLVLVGGGHAHVQVLRRMAMEPVSGARLTLVSDTPLAVYSGMVPGFIAGRYQREELEIDVVPLARRAAVRVVLARALGVDVKNRRLLLEGRPSLPYDAISFNVGSTVAGLDLEGVREHTLPTRPIGRLVERFDEVLARYRQHSSSGAFRVVVAGAGAGGVELSFTALHRLQNEGGARVEVTLVEAGQRVLPGYPEGLVARLERQAARRGITILRGRRVMTIEPGRVHFDDGHTLAFNALLWVTGAVAQPLFRDSGLPTDERGFVRVRPTLQVEGHDEIFAVGDCATLVEHPETPKAGVYAVRQGPYLTDNLRAMLTGGRLRSYRPQRDFLTLLNLGDGTALGSKWGVSFEGRWVMELKDKIDRRFMRRFQVLEPDGRLSEELRAQPAMGEMSVLCGGCAAKVGQSVLERALARLDGGRPDPSVLLGLATPDDAAAIRTPAGDVVVSTVDAFRAFTDDPHLVGRVAAVNAVSDLLAKGAEPRYALAMISVPETESPEGSEETLFQVLSGARQVFDELGVTLLGGHTTTAAQLIVGFSIDGFAPPGGRLLTLGGLAPGQALVLTKPLGTGVLFRADMQARARGPWVEAALASMLRLNAAAARVALELGASAATDVTGFGLVGHLATMVRASGVGAVLELDAVPALDGAVELLAQGFRSTFHGENERAKRGVLLGAGAADHPKLELLFDPQTSGGLLFAVAPERAGEAVEKLVAGGDGRAAIIGRTVPARPEGAVVEVVGKVREES